MSAQTCESGSLVSILVTFCVPWQGIGDLLASANLGAFLYSELSLKYYTYHKLGTQKLQLKKSVAVL